MKYFNKLIPYLFLITGLLIFFYPIILNSGNMPGDLGDARFINYVLEHGYQWFTGDKLHNSFWDMPFFYPYNNTLAFSDMLIGGMLFYIPIRLFTNHLLSAQTALQIWFGIATLLNFVSFYLLMRKFCKFKRLQSSAAAFLFAFGLPRHVQIEHLQLSLQFFMIFSILAFSQIDLNNSKFKNHILFLTGSIMFVLQLYTAFYFGWYMVFGAIVSILICLVFKDLRQKLFGIIKNYKAEILLYVFVSGVLLIPLLQHYFAINSEFEWTWRWLLKTESFLSSESYLNRFLYYNPLKRNIEVCTGIGLITTLLVTAGIFKSKYKKFLLLFVTIVVLLYWSHDLNKILFDIFPGATAIRAGGRCIFLILPVFAYGLANLLKNIKNKYVLIFLTLLFIVEQIPYQSNFKWTKAEHLQRISSYNFPKECKVVYYEISKKPKFEYDILDVMWSASEAKIQTANGYSGYFPEPARGAVEKNCDFAGKSMEEIRYDNKAIR